MAKAPEIIISLEKGEIAKLALKDGDVVVVKVPGYMMRIAGIHETIKNTIGKVFEGHKILVIPNEFELGVVEAEDGVA